MQPWTLISCLKKRNRKSIHAFFPHTMQCVYVAYLPELFFLKNVTLLNFVVCMWIICIKKQTKNTQKRNVFRLCSVHVSYLRKTNKQTKQNSHVFKICSVYVVYLHKKTNQTKTKHKTKQNKTKKYTNKQKTAMFSNFVVCMWPIFIKKHIRAMFLNFVVWPIFALHTKCVSCA